MACGVRYDFSNGASIVAVITMVYNQYVFAARDEEGIADFLYHKIGDRKHYVGGVPAFIEASSWCSLAAIGGTYEDVDFDIYIDEVQFSCITAKEVLQQ